MVSMRSRTVKRRATKYRGVAPKTGEVTPKFSCALDPDDPNAVECDECGAFVARLVSGRPRAHAPGGLRTNTRAGRFHCAGSGTHG